MAHASRKLRKLRRIKRERTLAFRMADQALKERDQARWLFNELAKKYDALTNPRIEEPVQTQPTEEVSIEEAS